MVKEDGGRGEGKGEEKEGMGEGGSLTLVNIKHHLIREASGPVWPLIHQSVRPCPLVYASLAHDNK